MVPFRIIAVVVAALALLAPAGAQVQDALGTCLADATTGRDRKDLVRWMFLAIAEHPDIKALVTPEAQVAATDSAKTIGALVTRLLADSCGEEARQAVNVGGAPALESAFERLGQVAMRELMTDKSVSEAIGRFEQFVDQERLKKIFGGMRPN